MTEQGPTFDRKLSTRALRNRLGKIKDAAEALTQELGLPSEAVYEVMEVIGEVKRFKLKTTDSEDSKSPL